MNQTSIIDTMLERKSIRHFEDRMVQRDLIEQIVRAGQRAPTGGNMQLYSFVLISDPEKKKQISQAIGSQKCMQEAPVWIMVCVDWHRHIKFLKHLGIETNWRPVEKLWRGIICAILAAENMVLAAEAFGLGSVFVGDPRSATVRIARILKMPDDVLPVVLLCIGYPAEDPPKRPRWPVEAVLHENEYEPVSEQLIKDYYEAANKRLVEMNYFQKGISSWAEHLEKRFPSNQKRVLEEILRRDLRELGFLF
jgi:nitroreductase